MSQLWEQQVVESGGLVISCTANISILYRDTWLCDVGVSEYLSFSAVSWICVCIIASVSQGCMTNESTCVSCFSRAGLQKMLRWCPELSEPWLHPQPVACLSSLLHTRPTLNQSPSTDNTHRHLHLLPTPLLPGRSPPWRRSWRAAWPPWIGFLSWPCRRPSARRTPRMPTGQAWARRVPYWILTPRWTRRRCSSTKMASRPTATPASSHSLSTARQRRRWHWARSTSGSVITFPTTGRRAAAGR